VHVVSFHVARSTLATKNLSLGNPTWRFALTRSPAYAQKIFSGKIQKKPRTDADPRSPAEKAVSRVFSKEDDSASGYSWFAREP
jgi:hypothetical protein